MVGARVSQESHLVCKQKLFGPVDVFAEPPVAVSHLSSSLLTEAHFHSSLQRDLSQCNQDGNLLLWMCPQGRDGSLFSAAEGWVTAT